MEKDSCSPLVAGGGSIIPVDLPVVRLHPTWDLTIMTASLFDELERTLAAEGAPAALDRLCAGLREQRDYDNLFYARLMAKRYELGVLPVPTAPTSDVPA